MSSARPGEVAADRRDADVASVDGARAEIVADVGEKALIRQVLSRHVDTARLGALEDCIVIDPARALGAAESQLLVYSMDHSSLIDRPLPPRFEWRYHGRWLAACTCNDVLAMGARPRGFSVDLAVRADTRLADIDDLYAGMHDVLDEYGAAFEGGNTDIDGHVETVALCWGSVGREAIIRRQGAHVGDYVGVTTILGLGWASFVLRKRGLFGELTPASREELEEYNLLPLAPHRAIVEAAQRVPGAITSGMDLSDGLAEFLYTISERSRCGVVLDEDQIPRSPLLDECASLLGVPAPLLAIEYGFDMPRAHGYTVAPERWDAVAEVFEQHGARLWRVGEVVEGRGASWRSSSGRLSPFPWICDDKCQRVDVVDGWFRMVEEQTA